MQALAAGDINNAGIRGADGDKRRLDCSIRDRRWCPGAAVIVRFPNSAIDLAHVENIRLSGNAGGGAGCGLRENGPIMRQCKS